MQQALPVLIGFSSQAEALHHLTRTNIFSSSLMSPVPIECTNCGGVPWLEIFLGIAVLLLTAFAIGRDYFIVTSPARARFNQGDYSLVTPDLISSSLGAGIDLHVELVAANRGGRTLTLESIGAIHGGTKTHDIFLHIRGPTQWKYGQQLISLPVEVAPYSAKVLRGQYKFFQTNHDKLDLVKALSSLDKISFKLSLTYYSVRSKRKPLRGFDSVDVDIDLAYWKDRTAQFWVQQKNTKLQRFAFILAPHIKEFYPDEYEVFVRKYGD